MKMTTATKYWLAVFAVLIAGLLLAYIRQPSKKLPQSRPVPVEVEPVAVGSIEETIEMTGWVRANQVVDVASKVPGRVESLQVVLDDGRSAPVDEGLAVKKGQQLAVIDHDVYLAQVAAAKSNVLALQVTLADAQREKERIAALFKAGSATQQASDKAVTALDLAAAQLDAARANLELAEINLRESTIVSPIDGTITARHIDQGNLIKTGDRLVTVEDTNTVKIIIAAPEKYSEKIKPQTPARVRVDAWPQKVFDASVFSVWPALDEQTHTLQVEIRLNNDQMLLKSGMFARVTLVTAAKNNAVVVAKDVVLGGKVDQHYVYVVNGDTAHKRLVEVGIIQADKCEITDGLELGETIVVNGMTGLADGLPVEIMRKKANE
jgi:membrane fusion protein (multidrug efflux system)